MTNMSSQPTQQQVYETSGNPVDKEPAERAQSQKNSSLAQDGHTTSHRQEGDQSTSTPQSTSLGRGIRGAPPGEESKGRSEEDVGRHNELDGAQMAAPGEGEVAQVVEKKPGASGAQVGLESDLDRKKEEQRGAREANVEKRQEGVDVAGVLGQRSAPADPTT
ncbi:hypothetical protein EJ08DRAFT_153929 [Tothia fuscella]|uniref:Uncharacterized protein n=1 Tax=Tothia fuscella TaxID=1048955 RepID=A0A9P4U511_9PEZI|nr:hypothetical protein EJ08DRAFT_153929 [Tothia fuscella]